MEYDEGFAPEHETSLEDGSNILAAISSAAREWREAKEREERLEAELKAAKQEVLRYEVDVLPELMMNAQQKTVTTVDGFEVSMSRLVRGSLPKGNPEPGVRWLSENGYKKVLRSTVTASTGKDHMEDAEQQARLLREAGMEVDVRHTVNPQTLCALVRELLDEGKEVPLATLGVFVEDRAKVKVRS